MLSVLLDQTRRLLGPMEPLPVPDDLAHREGPRFTLRAWAWSLGAAECRFVLIRGQSAEVANALIFPNEGGLVFVADYLATGGRLRLAFADVQCPGWAEDERAALAAQAAALDLPASVPAPDWAAEHSAGHYFHRRPGGDEDAGPSLAAYGAYLRLWMTQRPGAAADLRRFKDDHVKHSPAGDYMARVFGTEWTGRFLNEFLYA